MDIINKIDKLTGALNGYADDSLMHELAVLKQKILERKLYVVVVGLFKRGKSTLINSLLDAAILPSSVTPVTALITIVEYGEKAAATVWFNNNTSTTIAAGEIDEYVTEEKNPGNIRNVEYVHLSYPAPLLQYISLVDSPGLGSAYEHNTMATLSFIPRIDAALFLLSADIPVSKIDLELLEELQKHVQKIIFVFNKADLLQKEDAKKLIDHNKAVLSGQLKVPAEVLQFYIVSAMRPEEENFLRFKSKLQSIGENEKEHLLQASSLHQLQLLHQKGLLQLQFVADAYMLPIKELEERSSQIAASVKLMEEQEDEFESIIAGKIKMLQQTINEDVNSERLRLHEKVMSMINTLPGTGQDSLQQSTQSINTIILMSFNKTKEEWELKAKEHFSTLLEQYCRRSQSFLHELNANLSAFLGQNIELLSQQFDLNAYSSFYLTLDSGLPPVILSSSLWYRLMPFNTRQKIIRGRWRRHYTEVITRNAASILYDLNYKIQESFRRFKHDLSNKVNDVLSNMEQKIQDVIDIKKKTAMQSRDIINDIHNRINEVKNCIE